MPPTQQERFRGALIGLACGDAVGTTVEFKPRGSFTPLTDMVGGGPFRLQAGQWTDDTSMALCLAVSLIECRGFDGRDQMQRYLRWRDEGYLSSTGHCFDIGTTTATALDTFRRTGEPFSGSTNPRAAGNGCIMRLAPVPMFYASDLDSAIHYAAESSRTTHGAIECIDAARLFAAMLVKALHGKSKDEILFNTHIPGSPLAPSIQAIAEGHYKTKGEDRISGSGYVVHSLEAALWSFYTTTTYAEAILRSANLGDDADTTAAICGQIAGAYYGVEAIPLHWRSRLAMHDFILELADKLYLLAFPPQ